MGVGWVGVVSGGGGKEINRQVCTQGFREETHVIVSIIVQSRQTAYIDPRLPVIFFQIIFIIVFIVVVILLVVIGAIVLAALIVNLCEKGVRGRGSASV